MAPSLFLARKGGAQGRRLRQSRPRQQQRGRRRLFFGGVPLDARLHHQVDGVAVLDVVLLEQLGVREGLALQEEALRRGRGRAGLCGDLGLEGGYGVGGGYGQGDGEGGLEGLECDFEGGGR